MNIIRYPYFVDINKIKISPMCESKKYRYELTIPFENARENSYKTVIVILKNPSKADKKQCDITISKVCNAAKRNGYSIVKIYNMFPYKSTSAKNLKGFIESEKYYKYMEINNEYIKNAIIETDDVVFAWGTNTISQSKKITMEYQKRKKLLIDMCKNKNTFMVIGGKKEPLHGQRWSNDSEFVKFDL